MEVELGGVTAQVAPALGEPLAAAPTVVADELRSMLFAVLQRLVLSPAPMAVATPPLPPLEPTSDARALASLVRIMLDGGVTATDHEDRTALHIAAESGLVDVVQVLLANGAHIHAADGFAGQTALHGAADQGHVEVLRILLDAGANVNGAKRNGDTALHLAAFHGHVEAVQFLLERGASVKNLNNDEGTPLHAAVNIDYNSIDTDDGTSMRRLQNQKAQIVSLLLKHGADPNIPDTEGDTPLHFAACDNQIIIAEVLLKSGASVNAKTGEMLTPLQLAQSNGHTQCVQLLQERRWHTLQHLSRVVIRANFSVADISSLPYLPVQFKDFLGVIGEDEIDHHSQTACHTLQSTTSRKL